MKTRNTHQDAGRSARGSLWRAGALAGAAVCALFLTGCAGSGAESFLTDYFRIDVNNRGYITGMWNTTRESRNFSPADQPSPLLLPDRLPKYRSQYCCDPYPDTS